MSTTISASQSEVRATITATVRALMAARRMTAAGLADRSGITLRTMNRRLKVGDWSADEVARLAGVFGVTVADLYAGTVNIKLPHVDSNHKPAGKRSSRLPMGKRSGAYTTSKGMPVNSRGKADRVNPSPVAA